jgi:hypothetical protein
MREDREDLLLDGLAVRFELSEAHRQKLLQHAFQLSVLCQRQSGEYPLQALDLLINHNDED